MGMGVLPVCLSVYPMYAWYPWRPEEAIRPFCVIVGLFVSLNFLCLCLFLCFFVSFFFSVYLFCMCVCHVRVGPMGSNMYGHTCVHVKTQA